MSTQGTAVPHTRYGVHVTGYVTLGAPFVRYGRCTQACVWLCTLYCTAQGYPSQLSGMTQTQRRGGSRQLRHSFSLSTARSCRYTLPSTEYIRARNSRNLIIRPPCPCAFPLSASQASDQFTIRA